MEEIRCDMYIKIGIMTDKPFFVHETQWAFYATFATLPVLTLIYQYSRPGADGEMHWITRKVFDYQVEMRDVWRDRNVARTQAIERAAHDKHLFLYANMGEAPYYEVRFPEYVYLIFPVIFNCD